MKEIKKEGHSSDSVDFIYVYTRAQAIADGVLVDASKVAREAGIRFPVAITRELWNRYIVPGEEQREQGQSIDGRLWDTLFMFAMSARHCPGSLVYYDVLFSMEDGLLEPVKIKGHIGPGDAGEPVITLMLPHED